MTGAECRWVRRRLPLFAGADHRPADDGRIREHLVACGSCRKELGPFLRARRALVSVFAGGISGLDEGALHREILAAVRALPAPVAPRRRAWRAGLLAAGLFSAGFLLVQWAGTPASTGLLSREPLPSSRAVGGPTLPRTFGNGLRPLGFDATGTASPADAQGMMGRLRLRTLELEADLLELPPDLLARLQDLGDRRPRRGHR